MTKLTQTPPVQWLKTRLRKPGKRGQAFLELALVLPVLLIMLAGMTEVAFFIGRYLDALDLTREAARFASLRDYKVTLPSSSRDCSNPDAFDFYYSTSCIFSPPAGSPACDPLFCNGFNPYSTIDITNHQDDVVITAFTTSRNGTNDTDPISVSLSVPHPTSGYWALSNYVVASDTDNWKYDCNGNPVETTPYYTSARINGMLYQGGNTAITSSKGFVAVEFYFCYHQVLNLPIISNIMPNPARIHVYTVMPLPAAQPTPTVSP
jgi:hypothetical protein